MTSEILFKGNESHFNHSCLPFQVVIGENIVLRLKEMVFWEVGVFYIS